MVATPRVTVIIQRVWAYDRWTAERHPAVRGFRVQWPGRRARANARTRSARVTIPSKDPPGSTTGSLLTSCTAIRSAAAQIGVQALRGDRIRRHRHPGNRPGRALSLEVSRLRRGRRSPLLVVRSSPSRRCPTPTRTLDKSHRLLDNRKTREIPCARKSVTAVLQGRGRSDGYHVTRHGRLQLSWHRPIAVTGAQKSVMSHGRLSCRSSTPLAIVPDVIPMQPLHWWR